MNPHRLIIRLFLLLITGSLSSQISSAKLPAGGRLAVVVDERLAALRRTPELNGRLVRRLGRGRFVAIGGSRTTSDGVVFFFVTVTTRTRGWIQREAVVSATRAGDDRRLLDLIKASQGFDQIVRSRLFLDNFRHSPLRPQVLLLLADAAEEESARLSREGARRLNGSFGSAPEFTYFLNYRGLDRYNRQRVGFVFDSSTRRFHYDGAACRELVRRYPTSPEAAEARKRLKQLAQRKE
jgi:hypothetical protein